MENTNVMKMRALASGNEFVQDAPETRKILKALKRMALRHKEASDFFETSVKDLFLYAPVYYPDWTLERRQGVVNTVSILQTLLSTLSDYSWSRANDAFPRLTSGDVNGMLVLLGTRLRARSAYYAFCNDLEAVVYLCLFHKRAVVDGYLSSSEAKQVLSLREVIETLVYEIRMYQDDLRKQLAALRKSIDLSTDFTSPFEKILFRSGQTLDLEYVTSTDQLTELLDRHVIIHTAVEDESARTVTDKYRVGTLLSARTDVRRGTSIKYHAGNGEVVTLPLSEVEAIYRILTPAAAEAF